MIIYGSTAQGSYKHHSNSSQESVNYSLFQKLWRMYLLKKVPASKKPRKMKLLLFVSFNDISTLLSDCNKSANGNP